MNRSDRVASNRDVGGGNRSVHLSRDRTCAGVDTFADCAFIPGKMAMDLLRGTMRFVIIGGAVLVGLGLAAFGALAAFGIGLPQLASAAQSLTASVIAPSAPAPLTRLASNDKAVPAQTPFHQLAQSAESGTSAPETTGMRQAQAESTNVPPVRVAQTTPAQTTPAQSNANQAAAGAPPLIRPRPPQPARRPAASRPATSRAGWGFRASSKSTPLAAPGSASNTSSSTISSATKRSC